MTTSTEKEKGRFNNSVATAKDGLSVLRELIIVLVLALLLLWPGAINNRLQGAGFVKANIAGFEWERAQKAVQKTGEAQQQVEAVKQNTQDSLKKLEEISSQVTNPAVQEELKDIKSTLNNSLQTTQAAEKDLQSSRQAQEAILQAARPDNVTVTGRWGIVISGDKKFDEANYEADRAKNWATRRSSSMTGKTG